MISNLLLRTNPIAAAESPAYEFSRDGDTLAGELQLEVALEILEREIHALVALRGHWDGAFQ